jgi:hypothetical protein
MSKKRKSIKAARPGERRQTIAEIIETYRDKMKSKMRSASPAKGA